MADNYTPQTWIDGAGGGTPISASRLDYMETGIDAVDAAVQAVSATSVTSTQVASPLSASLLTQGLYARTMPAGDTGSGIRYLAIDLTVAGRIWGIGIAFGAVGYSDDNGATWHGKVVNPSSQGAQSIFFTNNFMWLVTGGAASKAGQLWRSPKPDVSGNGIVFTKVFDLTGLALGLGGAATDGGANSSLRNSCVAIAADESHAYVVEYGIAGGGAVTSGPSCYHSTNIGGASGSITFTRVKTWANGKHAHAVKIISGVPWATIGDVSYPVAAANGVPPTSGSDTGLWCATDAAAGTWQLRSLGAPYPGLLVTGINFLALNIGGYPMIALEQDSHHNFGPLVFPSQLVTANMLLRPLHEIPFPYVGSIRSLTLTSEGNLMWVTTGENLAIGPTDSVWIAKPPFRVPVLLEDCGNNFFGTLNDPIENGQYIFFDKYRITKEKFLGQ